MKNALYLIIVAIIALFLIALIPINVAKENSVAVSGTIKAIRAEGVNDMVIELKGHEFTYYVNRGFENGFEPQKAQARLIGRTAKIYYAKSWTPLVPFGNTSKHITHLSVEDSVVYSEWK